MYNDNYDQLPCIYLQLLMPSYVCTGLTVLPADWNVKSTYAKATSIVFFIPTNVSRG